MQEIFQNWKELEVKAYELFLSGDLDSAEGYYREALKLNPSLDLFINLGGVLCCNQKVEAAIQCFREALKIDPNHPEAKTFLGIALLLSGDYDSGWAEYEARVKSSQFKDFLNPLGKFAWKGDSLKGKTILVRSEQGAGDNIQFIRFLRRLKDEHECKVVLHCNADLLTLFESCYGVDRLIYSEGETVENCSACVYLGSLPGILKINPLTIPAELPYLAASSKKKQKWKKFFSLLNLPNHKLKVGIANTGNKKNPLNRFREFPLESLGPLLDMKEILFFGIQKDNPEFAKIDRSNFIDLSEWINDFDDTAAIMDDLDLVISVDTSVIHLAGALNKQAFLLLSRSCDWRWMLDRKDSPWYPCVSIFRQDKLFNWEKPIEEIKNNLVALLSSL